MRGMVARLYEALIESYKLRGIAYPTSNDGVPVVRITLPTVAVAWTYGAWTTLIGAGVLAGDAQVEAILLDNFVWGIGGGDGEFQVGVGDAGNEQELLRFPTTMASWFGMKPVCVRAGSRVAARYRSATGNLDTCDAYVYLESGF